MSVELAVVLLVCQAFPVRLLLEKKREGLTERVERETLI